MQFTLSRGAKGVKNSWRTVSITKMTSHNGPENYYSSSSGIRDYHHKKLRKKNYIILIIIK